MRLIHDAGDGERTLARDVETADTIVSQALGLMFRRPIPDDYALAFRFSKAKARDIHMFFVRFPLDVLWVEEGRVTRVERLKPWTGFAKARADLILELPAGDADDVAEGDRIELRE